MNIQVPGVDTMGKAAIWKEEIAVNPNLINQAMI